ncbi:MAG TPA: type II toxin-antitoxin system Phd/YefM family antitoxin [Kiloniellales bacterium]|nr:type II toxin-antitoxin system Phd/YefM family antitoxin [Kiloniellales bacterium]
MTKVALKHAKRHLDQLVDDTIARNQPVAIERPDGKRVILVSQSDYDALLETAHLMSTAANAARLSAAIRAADAGQLEEHDLLP